MEKEDKNNKQLVEENRQLQKDLLSERIMRIEFQIQLLGLLRNETQQKLNSFLEEAQPVIQG